MLKPEDIRFVPNGECGLTLLFNHEISDTLSILIQSFAQYCRRDDSLLVDEVIPAYQSLTFYTEHMSIDGLETRILSALMQFTPPSQATGTTLCVPVCYDPRLAPDMAELCDHTRLTPEQVIILHTGTDYRVHMLGFLPGFAYLGGLPSELYCPRKKVPDLVIPPGSVAIGGAQTGVYPVSSPGGWQVIGRTPLAFFSPQSPQPFAVQPLDKVRFVPIDFHSFRNLDKQ